VFNNILIFSVFFVAISIFAENIYKSVVDLSDFILYLLFFFSFYNFQLFRECRRLQIVSKKKKFLEINTVVDKKFRYFLYIQKISEKSFATTILIKFLFLFALEFCFCSFFFLLLSVKFNSDSYNSEYLCCNREIFEIFLIVDIICFIEIIFFVFSQQSCSFTFVLKKNYLTIDSSPTISRNNIAEISS